jgi:membrane protease YdiL (CAAX protease family)
VAWVLLIAAISSLSYGARFADTGPQVNDFLFRWSTAVGTFVLDGLLLLIAILIARGVPFREAFALRRPTSWRDAVRIAGVALAATYVTSLALEIAFGHASREQAVPQYWDQARVGVFVLNAILIAGWVPIVEESICRGIGFTLLAPFGERVAIAGSAVAFALAHGAVLDLPWVLVTGLGLGYLRARSGSLYPCIALHATVNGIAVLAAAYLGASVPTT